MIFSQGNCSLIYPGAKSMNIKRKVHGKYAYVIDYYYNVIRNQRPKKAQNKIYGITDKKLDLPVSQRRDGR
jgi:hypothetical protein